MSAVLSAARLCTFVAEPRRPHAGVSLRPSVSVGVFRCCARLGRLALAVQEPGLPHHCGPHLLDVPASERAPAPLALRERVQLAAVQPAALVRVFAEGLRSELKDYNLRTTVISPGAVDTELPSHITHEDSHAGINDYYQQVAIPADSFARAVAFAIEQPAEVDINEILFRPTKQEL